VHDLEFPRITYGWIKSQIDKESSDRGIDLAGKYSQSTIVKTSMPTELGALRKADGDEGFGA
jgi:GDP-D-mannose 3',5'-epimerase